MGLYDDLVQRIKAKAPPQQPATIRVQARRTPGDFAEAVDRLREEHGLPVQSIRTKMLGRRVPQRHVDLVVSSGLVRTQAVRLAERMANGEGLLLVMGGDAGRGKSIAAAFALSRRAGLWVQATELSRIDPPPPKDSMPTEGLDARMQAAGLLVIDDLGTEHSPGGFAASRLQDVVVGREANFLPTLITTNLSPESFRSRYGDRVASRLNAEGETLGWQTLTGDDLRVRNPRHPSEVDAP